MPVDNPEPTSQQSSNSQRRGLMSGFRTIGLFTLASRILGLARDVGMATLFGNGAILDAFTVAFRIPNLARRLFGEGALTAAFLPAYVRETERTGLEAAMKLASAILVALLWGLTAIVILGEVLIWGYLTFWEAGSETILLLNLTAILLPYLILICFAAQLSAILHAHSHFSSPALLPIVLNLFWIVAIWIVSRIVVEQETQIYLISAAVVLAGFLQVAVLFPALKRQGFQYQPGWLAVKSQVLEIGKAMLPVLVGISITQLNTFCDSLIAWGFSAPEQLAEIQNGTEAGEYLLQSGTASALYLGQRLYQFPLGVFGVALGTVLFPLLTRHAENGQFDRLRLDFTLGLKLILGIGIPASAGLVMLSEPLARLLFQYQAFDQHDALQTANMIAAYGCGVWAYCGLLIVHRGFFAISDRQTPMRVGLVMLVLNLVLNLTLIQFVGGVGLALSTAITAGVNVLVIAYLFQKRIGQLDWMGIMTTIFKSLLATVLMSAGCLWTLSRFPLHASFGERSMQVFVPLIISILIYAVLAKLLRMDELLLLVQRGRIAVDD